MELLVATTLGLGVVLAAVQLLKTHAAVALRVQADLDGMSEVAWALRTALRDVRRAGADPRRSDLEALVDAGVDRLAMRQDLDGDGAVESRSRESVAFAWSARNGGCLVRRVGAQSMSVLSRVPAGGLRFRYFDARGHSIPADAGLDADQRRRVRRVEIELDAVRRLGQISSPVFMGGTASVRVREGTG